MYLKKQRQLQSKVSFDINDIHDVHFNSENMTLTVNCAGYVDLEARESGTANFIQGSMVSEVITLNPSADPVMQDMLVKYAAFKGALFTFMAKKTEAFEGATIVEE
jgi:hypothetical protein